MNSIIIDTRRCNIKHVLENCSAVTITTFSAIGTAIIIYNTSTPDAITCSSSISNKIISSFAPITDLLQGLSYPVSFTMCGVGTLLLICGNRSKGLSVIKYAGIGYLLMQFLPAAMKLLQEVGGAIAK
jgi:hypothetical protein